ncbi:MAG: hypothetical protein ABSH19_08195 [Opitutales bacterium]|jgi:hypothetical protein
MTGASLTTVPDRLPSSHRTHGSTRTRPYFLFAIIIALIAHIVGLGLICITGAPGVPVRFPPAYVHYASNAGLRADAALREQALLFDSEPLFLPTPWNYASRAGLSQPVRLAPLFADYVANVTAPSQSDFPLQASAPGDLDPLAALQPGRWNFLAVFGQASDHSAKLAPRGALLRVVRLDAGAGPAGSVVIEQTWPAAEAPDAGQSLWGPATFQLVFTETGAVGAPLLINSSGLYTVDDALRAKLDAYFRRQPLPAGTYQAIIGP